MSSCARRSSALALLIALAAAGCVPTPPAVQPRVVAVDGSAECRTDIATVAFDFEGASRSRCAVEGERAFSILITPEHAPPINPSPWYAFRYRSQGDQNVTVRLKYLGARHRYAPVLTAGGTQSPVPLSVSVDEDGSAATLILPPGQGIVSAQELIGPEQSRADLSRWAEITGTRRLVLGRSHEGRPIEAVRFGDAAAPRLIVLLGRQHPPEVTGAIAMQSFVDDLAERFAADGNLGARYQVLVVPMVNPDGVAKGNWRANSGARDLNRDWGAFSQPETRAVKRWLDDLPGSITPVAMIDFHSTGRNLFYVQGDEASKAGRQLLANWLEGKEKAFPDYPFTIEPRNANPGSGTAKNWFFETYRIPAFTYEVADDADRAGTRNAAETLARSLIPALEGQ